MPILPSVYLKDGQCVALTTGEHPVTVVDGDAVELVRRLALVGEVCIIDLDAARSAGEQNNAALIKELLMVAKCRVGGGIRSVNAALSWLDIGVTKVILGTAASEEILSEIPNDRVVVALDVSGDEAQVVVEGRQMRTGAGVADRMRSLAEHTDEFLITLVDLQGSLKGPSSLESTAAVLKEVAGVTSELKKAVCIGGGIANTQDILELDKMGLVAQVGTALHTEQLQLGDVVSAFLVSDRPDGLYATVVVDQLGIALGLVYSDDDSIREAIKRRKGIYHSRKRGLWEKGLTSGDTQDLLRVNLDCDRDAIQFVVFQRGTGFCHLDRRTCWSEDRGIGHLFRTLQSRVANPVAKSYTNRLLSDAGLLASKLREEAEELIEAETFEQIAGEAADVVYFAAVMCARAGVAWEDVETMLDRRSRRVRRRKGDAKPGFDKKPQQKE